MMRSSGMTLIVVALLVIPAASAAVTIHVPSGQPTIQAGINAASDGDTVLVACDTYYEHGITMKTGITVLSETGNPACVTIDCTGTADQAFYIIGVNSSLIAGFTITGGEAPWGGALYADGSAMTIRDCVFSGNASSGGGGGVHWDDGAVTLVGCTFTGNTAIDGGGAYFYDDPGVVVEDCVFGGNAVTGGGGGATCDDSVCDIVDCTFDDNEGLWGAALAGYYSANVDVTGSTFVLNRPTGGIRSDGSIYLWGSSSASIENSIIAFNLVEEAVVCEMDGSAALTCSVVYGNEGGDWTDCIAGQDGSNGNMHVDPRFCGLLSGDYTLCSNSDCLPDNNPCLVLLGAHGQGCGACDTPVEEASWGVIKARWR